MWFLRVFGYGPFGASLITPGVVAWLTVMFGLSATIAGIEATFFALTIFQFTSNRYLAALVACVWFGLTYSLDRVISLSDTSHVRTRWKAVAGLLARCVAMSLLFLVAVPQVRQLAVAPEVRHHIEEQHGAARAQFLEAEASKRNAAVISLRKEVEALEAKLTTEISGNGESRQKGHGATAKNLELRLARKRGELAEAGRLAGAELEKLKAASDETLAQTYGVKFPGDGYAERRRITDKLLRENPAYGETANLAKYLLSGLFLLLVAAKVLEGEDVRTYLSTRMQSLYRSYLRGAFDAWLAPIDHACSGPVDAARFVSWIRVNHRRVNSLDNPSMVKPVDEPELRAELKKDEQRIEQDIAACTEQLHAVQVERSAQQGALTQLESRLSAFHTRQSDTERRRSDLLQGRLHPSATPSQRQSLLLALDAEREDVARTLLVAEGELERKRTELSRVEHDRSQLERRLRDLETERHELFQVTHRHRLLKNERLEQDADACVLGSSLTSADADHEERVLQ